MLNRSTPRRLRRSDSQATLCFSFVMCFFLDVPLLARTALCHCSQPQTNTIDPAMGFSFGRNKDRDTCSAAEEEIRTLRAALEAVELRVAALEAAARLPGKQPASNTADVATDTAAGQIVTSVTPPSPVAARVEPAQEAGAARLSAAQLSRLHTEAHEDEVTAVAISRGFSPSGASRRSAPASETPRFVAAGVGGRFPQTCTHSVSARITSDCHHTTHCSDCLPTTHCAGSIILRRRTDPWTATHTALGPSSCPCSFCTAGRLSSGSSCAAPTGGLLPRP